MGPEYGYCVSSVVASKMYGLPVLLTVCMGGYKCTEFSGLNRFIGFGIWA